MMLNDAARGDTPATADCHLDDDRNSVHEFWTHDDEQWAMFVSN